jgi:UDP-glucose 4-epimerase
MKGSLQLKREGKAERHMSYLITGGSGCVGSYVIRDLLTRGERVINYDFNPTQDILRQVCPPEGLSELVSVVGDVTDLPHLARTIKDHKIDVILHLASLQIPASNANPPLAERINVGGLINVLEAARILNVRKVVWSSSIAVFGPAEEYGNKPIANDAHHRPQSVYGAYKALGECLLNYYFDTYTLDVVGLRYTAIYGVGREVGRTSFTTEMIKKTAQQLPYEVPFGEDRIDWQYVEDVSRVTICALDVKQTKTRVFNTQGDVRSVAEGVAFLKRLEPKAELTLLPGKLGLAWQYDSEPAKRELGFEPKFTMEQGIEKTFNSYRAKTWQPN